MNFYCVYTRSRKKLDKYIKINRIKNKYIIDIRKIAEEEEVEGGLDLDLDLDSGSGSDSFCELWELFLGDSM